jgi:hypothetical protein
MPKYSRYVIAAVATIALHAVSLEAQRKKAPALDADIETIYTLSDGRQFSTHGHYYRSQDGHLREDSPLGAIITDIKSGTITMLNFETKEAHVIRMPATPKVSRPKNLASAASAASAPSAVPFGEATVEGRQVTKALAKGARGETHESWTDKDLGLVVFSKIESPGLTMAKSLRNVSRREPHPSMFTVPKGYTITDAPVPAQSAGSIPIAPTPFVPR